MSCECEGSSWCIVHTYAVQLGLRMRRWIASECIAREFLDTGQSLSDWDFPLAAAAKSAGSVKSVNPDGSISHLGLPRKRCDNDRLPLGFSGNPPNPGCFIGRLNLRQADGATSYNRTF